MFALMMTGYVASCLIRKKHLRDMTAMKDAFLTKFNFGGTTQREYGAMTFHENEEIVESFAMALKLKA